MKNAPGVIPALDTELEVSLRIVSSTAKLSTKITAFKIGSLLVMEHGLQKVCGLISKKTNIPIVLDMQKSCTDIPEIVEKQVVKASEAKVKGFIGAPMGAGSDRKGRGTLETFVLTCKKYDILPIIVLEMTHLGADAFLKPNAAETIAEAVCELEVPYVVAPATFPKRIKHYKQLFKKQNSKIEILSPGIGPQRTGNAVDDAVQAVEAGADHVIVGRAIYASNDPVRVISSIFDETMKAFKRRE